MKGAYRTRQQDELLEYLKETPGVHHTAAQIRDHFSGREKSIGTATIYRQLERFVADGTVRKYLLETGDSACYEYVPEREECAAHFHLKCEKCGKLIHLHCEELNEIGEHLFKEHKFKLNSMRTVFYGVCDECQKK